METLKYISADDETRAIANLRQKTINDHNSEMTVAREEEKTKIARNLLSIGLEMEKIAAATSLSIEEIETLKSTRRQS
jgi:predicted transposase YdaD